MAVPALSPLSRAGLGGAAAAAGGDTGQQGPGLGCDSSTSAGGLQEDVDSCWQSSGAHTPGAQRSFSASGFPAWSCCFPRTRHRAPEAPTAAPNWAASPAGSSHGRWMCPSQHFGALALPWHLWRCWRADPCGASAGQGWNLGTDGGSPPNPSGAGESSPVVSVRQRRSRAPGCSPAAPGKLLILKLPC